MEHDEPLFQIEVMPKIEGFWCNFTVYVIYLSIILGPFLVGVFIWWYLHSSWIGFLAFLFAVFASNVVTSKLRIGSIPFAQREMDYTAIAVVRWYIGKNICTK